MPLIMPASQSMRLAANPSRKALIMGTPPATADSNATTTWLFSAASSKSLPCTAISALLAVMTCLPFSMAVFSKDSAGSSPPMTSQTMSMSGSLTMLALSVVISIPNSSASALPTLRTDARVTSMARPVRRSISAALALRIRATP